MKIYIITGYSPYTTSADEGEYDTGWKLTLTKTYLLEAHEKESAAKDRVKELTEAVELWNRALRDHSIMKGVRASIFLEELAEKVGDAHITKDSTYSIDPIKLITTEKK